MIAAMVYWLLNNFNISPHQIFRNESLCWSQSMTTEGLLKMGRAKPTEVHLEAEVCSRLGRGAGSLKRLMNRSCFTVFVFPSQRLVGSHTYPSKPLEMGEWLEWSQMKAVSQLKGGVTQWKTVVETGVGFGKKFWWIHCKSSVYGELSSVSQAAGSHLLLPLCIVSRKFTVCSDTKAMLAALWICSRWFKCVLGAH